MRIFNLTCGIPLVVDAEFALTHEARVRGLTARETFVPGQGLWLIPCYAVTTDRITFPIDVLFVSRDGIVTNIHKRVPPGNTIMAANPEAYSTIELPAGIVDATGTQVGDQLSGGPDV